MNVIPLFPTLIWEHDIRIPNGLPDYCLNLSKNRPGRNRSNKGGGWQSNGNLQEDSFFYTRYLRNFLNELDFLPNFEVDSCWVNINYQGSYNALHFHPGHDLALVWYIQAPVNCGGIQFENPNIVGRTAIFDYMNPNDLESYNLYEDAIFPAIKHRCYIFPGDLRHLVEENESEELRISMSANLTFI